MGHDDAPRRFWDRLLCGAFSAIIEAATRLRCQRQEDFVMSIWSRSVICSAAIVAAMILPGTVSAGGDFGGVWQPYSRPAEWLGTMTVAPDRLSFATGPHATLEPVRAGGSVFRITARQGEDFLQCGLEAANYVGFHVLDKGQLARLDYSADAPPAEPTGSTATEVTRNGACSVMFYVR